MRRIVLLTAAACSLAGRAGAVVTSTGNVSPMPPAGGGNVTSTFFIGDSGSGAVSMGAGTGLNVTGGSVFVGNGAASAGSVTVTDLGTIFNTTGTFDLVIGSAGVGTVQASLRGRINAADDVLLGVTNGSIGSLFLQDFATIADIDDDLTVGSAGQGLVQVTSGARLFADASSFGQSNGSDGRATINGFGSLWRQDGAMMVGDAGHGEFQVQSQATAESGAVTIGNAASGGGVVLVTGVGTSWQVSGAMTVGVAGQGSLTVSEGAHVSNTGATRLATSNVSEAHVVVSGANAAWAAGASLLVGERGFATFDIRGGARVTTGNTRIGGNADARGEFIIEGRGSVLEITGTLDVSDPGEADLTIANSGLVTATGVVRVGAAGRLSLVGGRLEVGGAGGLTNNGLLQGGGRIFGDVNNAASGRIRTRTSDVLVLADTLTNAGIVEMDGGELETVGGMINNGDIDARSAILRSGAGLDNNAGAQLAIIGGTVDVFGAVNNNEGAQIVVGGNSSAVFHDNLTNNGQFFVFGGADVLALDNLAFTPTSELNLQLGLFGQSQTFGQIDAGGAANLAGALAVTLAPGFAPAAGESFQVLTAAGGVAGSFAAAFLPALTPGLTWDLDYNPQNVTLTVVPGLNADFNLDGMVTSTDLAAWRIGFGKTTAAVKADGDADGDGDVDNADFMFWQRELGMGTAAPVIAAVPEPASGALLIASLLLTVGRRRRG